MPRSSKRDAPQLGSQEDADSRVDQPGIILQETTSQANNLQTQQSPPGQQESQSRLQPFNLGPLETALPDLPYQNYGPLPQRYPPAPGPSGLPYQVQNVPQYAGMQAMGSANAPYYQGQYQGVYISPSQSAIGKQSYHQEFMQQQHQFGSPHYSQPNPYSSHNQMYSGLQQPALYGALGNPPMDGRVPLQQHPNDFLGVPSPGSGAGRSSSTGRSSSARHILKLWYVRMVANGTRSIELWSIFNCPRAT
jgi:hypothetical protein